MNLQSVSKAIAGAVATAIVAYATKHGVDVDNGVTGALSIVIAAAIGFVVTYVAPRNK